jgi:hypothetical protein
LTYLSSALVALHRSDPTDLRRRLVKEDLYTFAGTKLFLERRSYTAEYELSEPETVLYEANGWTTMQGRVVAERRSVVGAEA